MTVLNPHLLQQLLADLKHFLNHVLKTETLSSAAHDARAAMLDRVSTVLTEIQPNAAAEEEEEIYDAPHDEDNDSPDSFSRLSDTTSTSEPDTANDTCITLPAEAMTASAMKSSASKHGPLYRKEKFLFVDQYRRCWAAVHAHCIFIYSSDKDSRPVNAYVLAHYEARPAPHLTKDKNKKDQYFEMVSPGRKTQFFMARTTKDMKQWITAINSESEVIGTSDETTAKIMRDLPLPPSNEIPVTVEATPPQTYEHMIEQEESEEEYYNIEELGFTPATNTDEHLEQYDDIEHFNNDRDIPLPPRPGLNIPATSRPVPNVPSSARPVPGLPSSPRPVPKVPSSSRPVPNIPGIPLPPRAIPIVSGTSRSLPQPQEEEEEYDDIDAYHKSLPPSAPNSSAKPTFQNNNTLSRPVPIPPKEELEEEYDDIDAYHKSMPQPPTVPPANNKPGFLKKENRPVPEPTKEELEEEYDDIDAYHKSMPPPPTVPPANNKPDFLKKENRSVPEPPKEELEEKYDDIDPYQKSPRPLPAVPSANNKPTSQKKESRVLPQPPKEEVEEQYDDIDAFQKTEVPPPPKVTIARPSTVPPPIPKAFKELPPRSVVIPKSVAQTFNQNKPVLSKPKTTPEPEEEYDDIDSFQNKDPYYNVDSPNKASPSPTKVPPPPPNRTSVMSSVSSQQPPEEDFYDDVGADSPTTTPSWANKSTPNTGSFIHQLQSKVNSMSPSKVKPTVNKVQPPVRSSGPPLAEELGSAKFALKPVLPSQNAKPSANINSKPAFLKQTSKPDFPSQSSKPGFLNLKPVVPNQGAKPGFLKTGNQFSKPNAPSAMSKPGMNQFSRPGAQGQASTPGGHPMRRGNSGTGNISNLIKQMQASLVPPVQGKNGEDTYEPVN